MSKIQNISLNIPLRERLEEQLQDEQALLDAKVKEVKRSPFSNSASEDSFNISRSKKKIAHLHERISDLKKMEEKVNQLGSLIR